jgi:hypothetical protein
MVSALPYFTWLMILVVVAAVAAQTAEVFVDSVNSVIYIWWMDLFFIVFTVAELILKVGVARVWF